MSEFTNFYTKEIVVYYLSVNALARALKENRINEWEKTKYLIANFIIFSLATMSSRIPYVGMTDKPQELTPLSTFPLFVIFDIAFIFLITIYGIYYCYKANQQGDDKDFIARFICLHFPISIEIYAALFVLSYLVILGVAGYLFAGKPLPTDALFIFGWVANLVALAVKYLWIRKKILFIAQK